ncbi:MAG: [protein-PII] uridylyltransferase [Betaproteobacteria bacterium]|nr:[protein-PII] uridylyltransferase [Betaproteobacteria bacterium]
MRGGFDARDFVEVARNAIAERRIQLAHRFHEGTHVNHILARQSEFVDRLLRELWQGMAMPDDSCLVAVGGYGRGRLFPYSDVDLMILFPSRPEEEQQSRIEGFVGCLWDCGLDIGFSARTVDECLEQSARDITVQTTLLEARRICGSAPLFERFEAAYRLALDPHEFCEAKLLERQQRHTRYNDIAYSLEPNLKENPGGLRDLQIIIWIARASGLGSSWHALTAHGIVTEQEAARLARHENLLQSLRTRMHYLVNRREDRLVFDLQSRLAREMGLVEKSDRRASEQIMQRFYRTTKSVLELSDIILANLRGRLFPVSDTGPIAVDHRFQIRNELLELRSESLYDDEPAAILETFLLWQRHPEVKGLAASTLRALWHARRHVNRAFRSDPTNRQAFMQILRQPSGVTHTLRRLNRLGLLGLYVPAFGRIVGRMQHDLFHVYTVDEHILTVVRNLRRFAIPEMSHEYPLCSRLMSEFARPEVLYLAGLFHDIAKGRGGDHSLLGKVDATRFCRAHGLSAEDVALVGWLVEHHLTLSITAQKKDLTDPNVINTFADVVQTDRRLVALYLLTVADIRGTSPKVWNAWKAKLLEDLFRTTRKVLGGSTELPAGSVQDRKDKVLVKLQAYALSPGVEERLWARLGDGYFLRHDAGEIAWHTRQLFFRVDTKEPVVRARLSPIGEGLEVMIYMPDQKFLFARICAFFERLGYNIVEARIYTSRDGYALDSFLVMDPGGLARSHYRDVISYVEHELAGVLREAGPLGAPARGRVSRQLKAFPLTPEVTIRPDERIQYFYLNLIAGDRPGLLSLVARTLSEYNIDVQTAKINTLGSRAEDVFLLKGDVLRDPKKVIRLEADLIHQLEAKG